jgi:hypothetical protein
VLLIVSGCSALDGSGEEASGTTISESVVFPAGGVVGEPAVVQVPLNNTGDTEETYNATLTADGEAVASESVTLGGGESETVSLSHTFAETGEQTLSVGNQSQTVTVYETPLAFIDNATDGGSRHSELTMRLNMTIESENRTQDARFRLTESTDENLTAGTSYTESSQKLVIDSVTYSNQTGEAWTVDGTRYSKTTGWAGEPTYSREPVTNDDDEDDDMTPATSNISEYFRTDHTDDAYVFQITAENATEATELWAMFGDESGGDTLTSESVTDVSMDIRFDRQTGRALGASVQVRGENGDELSEFDGEFELRYSDYGEPVTVEVPKTVTERASESGTTVDSAPTASLVRP